MPLLRNEDGALRTKLAGLTVSDANAPGGRGVAVRFRLPEGELADATFPMITIDHGQISRGNDREHRGFIQVPYAPEGYAPWADMSDATASPYFTQQPIPLNIDYRVSVYARKAEHLVDLVAKLAAFDYLPPRFGYLAIPADGTVRSLFLMGGPEFVAEKDENNKRLLRAMYLVRVVTELFEFPVEQFVPVEEVDLDVYTPIR